MPVHPDDADATTTVRPVFTDARRARVSVGNVATMDCVKRSSNLDDLRGKSCFCHSACTNCVNLWTNPRNWCSLLMHNKGKACNQATKALHNSFPTAVTGMTEVVSVVEEEEVEEEDEEVVLGFFNPPVQECATARHTNVNNASMTRGLVTLVDRTSKWTTHTTAGSKYDDPDHQSAMCGMRNKRRVRKLRVVGWCLVVEVEGVAVGVFFNTANNWARAVVQVGQLYNGVMRCCWAMVVVQGWQATSERKMAVVVVVDIVVVEMGRIVDQWCVSPQRCLCVGSLCR